MRYMMLIYGNEAAGAEATEADWQETMQAYNAFQAEAGERILSGDALHPTSTATTVRLRDGNVLTTDGPFAETKEQLGGFYILNCENLDEAIAMAAKIPGAKHGCVEVRPIMEF